MSTADVETSGLIGAIEAGGTKFVLALARADGAILAREQIPTGTPDTCFLAMTRFFREASARAGAIGAFGVASFGPIDIDQASPTYGTFTTTPKPGWTGASIRDALSSFAVPVLVDTDVNGAALGEWLSGAGVGCGTLAYTTVGTGIGSGLVRDGKSLMGFTHYECGHIPMRHDYIADPFPGSCPFHADCAEGMASGTAIMARWGQSLSDCGDPAERIELVAGYLAQLAANLTLMHMPDRLVFGGGVMKTPGLIDALRTATEALLAGYVQAPQLDKGLRRYIVLPGHGDDAGITGAIEIGRRALKSVRPVVSR